MPATPESSALVQLRRRYESTPRTLDDDLQRMARGDRGCLGDAVAGAGAVGLIGSGIAGYLGLVGYGPTILSAALLIGGFFLSAANQARSGPIRQRALTEGPLALGRVVRADPALFAPGDATYPALIVFTVDPERRFDAAYLHQVADRVLALREAPAPPDCAAALTMLRDVNQVEVLRLPPALAGPGDAYLGVVCVDPRRLPARRVEDHLVPIIAAPELGFVEHV